MNIDYLDSDVLSVLSIKRCTFNYEPYLRIYRKYYGVNKDNEKELLKKYYIDSRYDNDNKNILYAYVMYTRNKDINKNNGGADNGKS